MIYYVIYISMNRSHTGGAAAGSRVVWVKLNAIILTYHRGL
jgi:hypothetical protein